MSEREERREEEAEEGNIIHLLNRILQDINKLEIKMGMIEDALAAEEATITEIVTLVQNLSAGPTQASLDAANAALAALQVQDDADKAALQTALDELAAATATVQVQTAQLQALVPPAPAA